MDDNESLKLPLDSGVPEEHYRVYCINEDSWIGPPTTDRQAARNRSDHHNQQTKHQSDAREYWSTRGPRKKRQKKVVF